MAGPSQPSVTDEVWDDDRVRSFLDMESVGDENRDFHVLLKAYRGMRPDDFERFLRFFLDDDRDVNATDKSGRTLWEIIRQHRQGADFIQIKEKLVN